MTRIKPPMRSPARRLRLRWKPGALAAIVLAIAATSWCASALGLFANAPVASGDTPVTLSIGGETVRIPASSLRFADQRRGGPFQRVEVELKWPEMTAPDADNPVLLTTARDERLVFIAIEPRETDLDTSDRIATIYQTFLASDQSADRTRRPIPDGLIRRAFLDGTAYEGEVLYFEPGSVHPFAARCYPPAKGEPPQTCLRDVRLGTHLLATIRFPIAALDSWRGFRDRTDQIFAEMTGSRG